MAKRKRSGSGLKRCEQRMGAKVKSVKGRKAPVKAGPPATASAKAIVCKTRVSPYRYKKPCACKGEKKPLPTHFRCPPGAGTSYRTAADHTPVCSAGGKWIAPLKVKGYSRCKPKKSGGSRCGKRP